MIKILTLIFFYNQISQKKIKSLPTLKDEIEWMNLNYFDDEEID